MQKGCIMCATKIDFKQFGFTEQQWNSLSAKKKEQFQAQWNAWDEATKDKFRQVMAEKTMLQKHYQVKLLKPIIKTKVLLSKVLLNYR